MFQNFSPEEKVGRKKRIVILENTSEIDIVKPILSLSKNTKEARNVILLSHHQFSLTK